MATDKKKHSTIAAGETPSRQALADMVLSVNDIVPVASATERSQLVTALDSTDFPVGSGRPLTVARADARPLHQVEISRGGAFVPVSGVLSFSSKASMKTWTDANSSMLTPGDRCVTPDMDFRWTGEAWRAVLPHGAMFVGVTSATSTVTVDHPLGQAPGSIVATDRNQGAASATRKIAVVVANADQIQFYVTNDGGGIPNNPVEFYWLAFP